jgi:hypothetical protein
MSARAKIAIHARLEKPTAPLDLDRARYRRTFFACPQWGRALGYCHGREHCAAEKA